MHTITSIKKLINDSIANRLNRNVDPRTYSKVVRDVNFLRECKRILESGIDKRSLIDMKFKLITKIEVCLVRIENENKKYAQLNKRAPSKVIKGIKEDFNYSVSLNQIKTINFILNEKSVQ